MACVIVCVFVMWYIYIRCSFTNGMGFIFVYAEDENEYFTEFCGFPIDEYRRYMCSFGMSECGFVGWI